MYVFVARSASFGRDRVDDSDDDRTHWCPGVIEYLAGAVALIEDQNGFAISSPDGVESDDLAAAWAPVRVESLRNE